MSNVHYYMTLIQRFLDRQIQATEFEHLYLNRFKNETERFGEEMFDLLEGVFSAAEEFCSDPELRGDTGIDEAQLREECEVALRKPKDLTK